MAANNGGAFYRVSTSAEIRERLRRWGELASEIGVLAGYVADLKVLNQKLNHAPKAWGDPLRTFHAARLRYFRGLTTFLVVHYAVHLDQRLVFVKDITLRPNTALGQS